MQSFFISSTFRDMQGERDALHRTVMPRVRQLAKEYGQSVQFVDLRWGISTGDMEQAEAQEKILEVCLGEIDACVPYMIVLLGDRYGWLPGAEVIGHTAAYTGFSPDSGEISVTELEIQYGIWKNNGMLSRCIFCFREPLDTGAMPEEQRSVYEAENAADRQRMAALKQKIVSNPTAQIYRYRLKTNEKGVPEGYEAFAEGLTEKLLSMLRGQWGTPRRISWVDRERQEDLLMAESLTANFVGLEETRSRLKDTILKSDLTVIEGGGGSGKSAMMARLAKDLGEKYRTEIIFCGASDTCMHTVQLLDILTWRLMKLPAWLAVLYEQERGETDISRARERWNRACREYDGEPVFLFIDAIDQLIPDEALLQSWFIPARMPENLRIIVSTTGTVGINHMLLGSQGDRKKLVYRHAVLEPPTEAWRREIVLAQFAREHKQVSEGVLSAMLAHPLSSNMLCLNLMVRWLVSLGEKDFREIHELERTMDGAKAIESYLLKQIGGMPQHRDPFIQAYIMRIMHFLASEDTEGKQDYARCVLPLYFISMTRHGLSREQMEGLQQEIRDGNILRNAREYELYSFWREADFSRMCAYMDTQLVEREDGRVDIAHRLIRDALRQSPTVRNYSTVLAIFLVGRETEDVTRLEDLIPVIMMSETDGWEQKTEEQKKTAVEFAHMCLQDVISDAGNLKNSHDPEEAARGREYLENLKRNVIADLMTGYDRDRDRKVELLSLVLSDAAEKGERHFYWLFEFYIHGIVKELEQRGMQEKAYACSLVMTAARKLYDAGKQDDFAGWTEREKKRQLLWQQYTQQLIRQISGAVEKKQVRWIISPEISGGLMEAFEDYEARALNWMPEDPRVLYRLGALQCHRALFAARGARKQDVKECARRAEAYLDRMTRCTQGISPQILANFYGWGMSMLAELFCMLGHDAIFLGKQHYRKAEGLMKKAFAYVQTGDKTRVCDHETWLRMIWRQGAVLSGLSREQEAAELLLQTYRAYESVDPPLDQAERRELSEVGIRLGWILNYGYVPGDCYDESKGESKFTGRSRLYRMILRREQDYLDAANEDGTTYLYKMMHLKQFQYMTMPSSRKEERLRLLDEIAADSAAIRASLDGTEEFTAFDLDQFDAFIQKLRENM